MKLHITGLCEEKSMVTGPIMWRAYLCHQITVFCRILIQLILMITYFYKLLFSVYIPLRTLNRHLSCIQGIYLDIFLVSLKEEDNTLQWRHNGRDCVSNHQPRDCLLNRLFRRWSKKTSKLRVTGLCAGNSPGTGDFPAQLASYAENVSIW